MDDDEAGAVAAARGGDEAAFRLLYRLVQPGLLRYLRGLVGPDAEDVASEAWLQIVRDLGGFSGDLPGFRAWAATIARHRALDHLRWRQRRPVAAGTEELLAAMTGDGDTERQALESLSTTAAVDLIATLPPDQAEAVLLRVVLGLDASAAARVPGGLSASRTEPRTPIPRRQPTCISTRRLAAGLLPERGAEGV